MAETWGKLIGWLSKLDKTAENDAQLLMQLMGDIAYNFIYERSRNMALSQR